MGKWKDNFEGGERGGLRQEEEKEKGEEERKEAEEERKDGGERE